MPLTRKLAGRVGPGGGARTACACADRRDSRWISRHKGRRRGRGPWTLGQGASRGPANTLGPGTGEDTLPSPPPPPGTRARPVSEAETPSNSLKVNLPRGERRGKGAGGGVCVWKACVKFQPLMTRGGKVPGPWERRQGEGWRGVGVRVTGLANPETHRAFSGRRRPAGRGRRAGRGRSESRLSREELRHLPQSIHALKRVQSC